MSSAFSFYQTETVLPLEIRELHYCGACGKLTVLKPSFKYCWRCAQHLLLPDPIDVAIQLMIQEQENLLRRKYIKLKLNEARLLL